MRSEHVRRTGVFAVLFAGSLGLVAWLGDGLTPPDPPSGNSAGATEPLPPANQPMTSTGKGLAVGRGHRGRLTYDAEKLVAGKRVRYRARVATWGSAVPLDPDRPDMRKLATEDCTIIFFREPDEHDPTIPRAVEGPGTTRVEAARAILEQSPEGARLRAQLRDDVRVVSFEKTGDPTSALDDLPRTTLTAPTLDLESVRTARGGTRRTVASEDRVRIESGRAKLTGTGLTGSGDLGRLELRRQVVAEFEAGSALWPEPGRAKDEPALTRVTSSGPALLEATDPTGNRSTDGSAGGGKKRPKVWRATFRDDVSIRQGELTMTTDRLFVEYLSDATDDGFSRYHRFEAEGNFELEGGSAGRRFTIRSDSAKRWRESETVDHVLFEGGTDMTFHGVLGRRDAEEGREAPPATVTHIRCSGPARLKAKPHPLKPGITRIALVFNDDVVVTQTLEATGEETARLEAPVVTLFADQSARRDLEPDVITAQGGVFVRHVGSRRGVTLEANARTATWTALRKDGSQRLILNRDVSVKFTGKVGLNPFGGAGPAPQDGILLLTCRDEFDVVFGATHPDEARPAAEALLTAQATGDVLIRKLAGETEPYSLGADKANVVFDRDQQLSSLSAYGNARFAGRAEDGSGRRGEATGGRIRVVRVPGEGEWAGVVSVFGHGDTPGLAIVRDPDGSRHELRAHEIRYTQNGSVLVARRRAHAVFEIPAGGGKNSDLGATKGPLELVAANVTVTTDEIVDSDGGRRTALRRVEATGSARMWGSTHEITADKLNYDAVSGRAQATGNPARVSFRQNAAYTNLVQSPHIEAWFDVTEGTTGEILRATCTGGRVMGFIVPKATGGEVAADVERIIVDADGPIVLDRDRARARGNVRIRYESRKSGRGNWKVDTTLTCEEVEITFDRTGTGDYRDRILALVATGNAQGPVRMTTPKLDATADKVVMSADDHLMHLTAQEGRDVSVRVFDPPESFRCDSVSIDYVSYEWANVVRPRYFPDNGR